ncbi:hypothetical protein [Streptomyces sp. C10]|uniref:hypothetical protein n=1 Tax=Streptomyces sp. C10 TaxID=531941 RepID=UPI00397F7A5A
MSTTNGQPPEDSQSQGPAGPPAHGQAPAGCNRTQDAFAWTSLGLTGALCTAGVVLISTGHVEAGTNLIAAGVTTAGIRARQ